MSIATEISRLQGAKADIKTAIERYGVTVPAADTIDDYAPLIDGISGGSWLPSASTILATFSRRQSGGQGPATVEKIYGRTIVWNQLIPINPLIDVSGLNGEVTVTDNNDGSFTLNGTASSDINFYSGQAAVIGHKMCYSLGGDFAGMAVGDGYTKSSWGTGIFLKSSAQTPAIYIFIKSGTTLSNVTIRPNSFDLTLATLDEITTVAQFTALYPLPYYAYDPGSLQSLAPEAIESRGINQWDEEWEQGAISVVTGNFIIDATRIRSKNYIPVSPNTDYYFQCASLNTSQAYILFYRADKSYATYIAVTSGGTRIFTIPQDCYYIKFSFETGVQYGGVYKNDICINISNAAINGQYFPFRGSHAGLPVLKYFPDGMKSAGTVYDELTPKKAITRMGMVDMGTLQWTAFSGVEHAFQASVNGKAFGLNNLLCAKYIITTDTVATMADKTIKGNHSGTPIYVKDLDYSDPAAFTTAMSGVYLVYELATPVETDIDEQMTYLPDLGGTEEVTPITAPFKADIRYAKQI